MTTKQISVTRALVELKRLGDRISGAIASGKFVSRTQGMNAYRKVVGSSDSVEVTSAKIKASFDSVDDLISNREKMKAAIVLSNANTKVTILGREMTVAEAIELKSSIAYRNQYCLQLRSQLYKETTEIDRANTALEAAIDASMNAIYGSEKGKIDADTLKSVSNPQREQKGPTLLDPFGIEARITKLGDEISELTSEVNFILSESNAKTLITV